MVSDSCRWKWTQLAWGELSRDLFLLSYFLKFLGTISRHFSTWTPNGIMINYPPEILLQIFAQFARIFVSDNAVVEGIFEKFGSCIDLLRLGECYGSVDFSWLVRMLWVVVCVSVWVRLACCDLEFYKTGNCEFMFWRIKKLLQERPDYVVASSFKRKRKMAEENVASGNDNIRIVSNFLLHSPPGEFNEVLIQMSFNVLSYLILRLSQWEPEWFNSRTIFVI